MLDDSDFLVDCSELKKCKLWPGSFEEYEFKTFGLRRKYVRDKISRLERCDDLTEGEAEYLVTLKRSLTL